MIGNQGGFASPVAIGGVGGSGTRVVAQFLNEIGFYIGQDLNHANDNLWFTLLFKRPKWFRRVSESNPEEILNGLKIFEKLMAGSERLSAAEFPFVAKAVARSGLSSLGGAVGPLWRLHRGCTLVLRKSRSRSHQSGWGWKEPNTHIYLPYLAKRFENLKYVHLIRHGVDMALSSNQLQLYNWGDLFGVRPPEDRAALPKASLQYWVAANKRAVDLGKELLGSRFLLLNFDELCRDPRHHIRAFAAFLGADPNTNQLDTLASLVKTPASTGRYRHFDLSRFSEEDIESVRRLGFEV
jgi:hypothetical protein